MSALACVLELDGGAVHRRDLDLMAGRMKHRGGMTATFADPLAMGVFPGHATEPLMEQSGEITMLLDGRIDNRRDLAAQLGTLARDQGGRSDVELLLLAYRKWGRELAARLVGDFAFLIWDARQRLLLAARDPMGMRSLFYRRIGQTLYIATDLNGLLLDTLPQVQLSGDYIVTYLNQTGIVDTPATPWTTVHRLPKGCLLIAETGEISTTRYWDLRNAPDVRFKERHEYSDRFRELLTEAVRCRLPDNEPTAVLLSGGLDSNSIYAVGRRLTGKGQQLFPVSAWYDRFADCDERTYIQSMVERFGTEPVWVRGDESWMFRDLDQVPNMDEPLPIYTAHHFTSSLYKAAVANGARVILDGYGGDQTLNGSWTRMGYYFTRLQWGRLIKTMRHVTAETLLPYRYVWSKHVWGPLVQSSRFLSDTPPDWSWLGPGMLQAIPRLEEGASFFRNPAKANHYRIVDDAIKVLAFDTSVCAPLGADHRHPYLDRRLAEFLHRIPDELRLDEGLGQKAILREALIGILPDTIRLRPGKTGHLGTIYHGIQQEFDRCCGPLLKNSRLVEFGIANKAGLERIVQRFRLGQEQTETVWLAILLEHWLRRPATCEIMAIPVPRTVTA